MKLLFVILLFFPFGCFAQAGITKSIKDFGAKGNGRNDDQDAFVQAAAFFNKRNGHGKLIIPKGIYIVGRQAFNGNKGISYKGDNVLDLINCHDLIIEGKPGAVLKNRDSLRLGTFSPVTGLPFFHQIKKIYLKPEYAKYSSSAGNVIVLSNCSNIQVTGLKLDGNSNNFRLGGTWGIGDNPYELIHYGIYISDSHDVKMKNCIIENFACDGIYIINVGKELKTFSISMDKCKVNYNGRNALSWLGGENIQATNCDFSNSGQGRIKESPCAGIDIEVENNSFCRKGIFSNCKMENNTGSALASGSKKIASDVLFKNCLFASPRYYAVFLDASSHCFLDCKFYGTVLIWYNGAYKVDGPKFIRCLFDENYKGKKMYDNSYQFGMEASGVQIDSCIFKAYSTMNYYMASPAKDCDPQNPLVSHVSNSSFYNYGGKTAGLSWHSIFYNNKFYALQGVNFQNQFNTACQADAGKNEFYIITKK